MFKRLMLKAVPFWVLALAVQLMLLGWIMFGSIVVDTISGSSRLGAVGRGVVLVASIPQTLVRSAQPDTRMNAPGTHPKLPDGLWINPAGGVRDDGYMLVSRYRVERKRYVVELLRLSDGKVLKTYAPDVLALHARSHLKSALVDLKRDRGPEIYIMYHPMLTPQGGLIFHHVSPLVSIDRCSRPIWTIDGIFHHAIERDRSGDYWVSYTFPKANLTDVSPKFDDQALARVSPAGKVLSLIRVRKILEDNGLQRLIDSYSYTDDPYHLNDIQPTLVEGPFWKAGDLFLSFRNFSTVMMYRPSTGKVLWWRQGVTFKQHDIQILDDHRIAIFDNNARPGFPDEHVAGHNRIAIYDFTSDSFSYPYDAALAKENVATITQGRGSILPNGDTVVEETQYGRILRLAPDGTVRWRYISARADGTRTLLGWSRYLDRVQWEKAVNNAVMGSCS